jgi:hypothetical protein
MKITTSALMRATEILCQHLEQSGHKEVDLPGLYYWAIPKEHEYNSYEEPSDFTIGSLEDDWTEINKMIENPDRAIGYGFVWLGALFRAVGQKVVQ